MRAIKVTAARLAASTVVRTILAKIETRIELAMPQQYAKAIATAQERAMCGRSIVTIAAPVNK